MDLSLLGMLSAAGGGSSSSKKADGNPVVLDGLQGDVPFNSVTLSGKNLLIYPYDFVNGQSYYGVVVTDNGDGGIRINGAAQDDHNSSFYIVSPGKLFFKGNAFLSGGQNDDVRLFFNDGNANIWDTGSGVAVAYADGCSVAVWIRKGTTVDTIIYPQLELGSTPTSYEPPITGRELTVGVCGKNLIPYPYYNRDSKTHNGITFTVNGDGTITANGTAENTAEFTVINKNTVVKKGTYCISGCPKNTANGYIACGNDGVRLATDSDGSGGTFTVDNDANGFTFVIRINSGVTVENLVFRPQLELGSTATAYEPYHGTEYTITPDSNPYTVPVDIIQQDGINVLSIADDSNPTISVSGNKASEQLGTIYRTLNNKPVLLFDGNIPTSSSAGYAEFTIDKEYSALIIVPICNELSVYEPGACTVIPIGYMTEEEQGFTAYGYPRAVQRVNRPFIKRIDNTIYVRSSSTACNRMTIYGI